jgi:two-component system sensor histidine kinase/response regulator
LAIQQQMIIISESHRDVAASNTVSRWAFGAKLADAFSCSPDKEADRSKLRILLFLALSVMLLFVSICFFNARWYESGDLAPLPIRLFDIALTLVAIAAVRRVSIRRWRWWAMGFCSTLTAMFLVHGLAVGDEEPLFVGLFMLALDTAVILPWGGRWQLCLTAVGAVASMVGWACGIITWEFAPYWMVLIASMIFGTTIAFLKDYSFAQRLLIEELQAREASFRAECEHRAHAEASLHVEVTEREAAEKLAQKREAILRKILETSLDLIIISRLPELTYLYANDQFRAIGYTFEEIRGKTPAELSMFASAEQGQKMVALALEHGRVSNFELDVVTKAGKIVPYQVSAVVSEIDGEMCLVSMSRDITQRKQMEHDLITAREDALAASRAKSEFLSSMSHEIRTPMNAVLGMADLLIESKLTTEQRRYLDVMVANGNSLLELINGILDLARIESGRMQIEKTEFDLAELIDKTISTFGVQAHSKGLELIARLAPGVPSHVVGDPLRLRQILINFLGNAIKFTENGEVVLEVDRIGDSRDPAELRFTVADTGIGIAAAKLEAIFSSFTQADSSTTRKYGGTGLGLAIAQRLVALMGGQISVESELGRGSKFSFTTRLGLTTRVISPTAHVVLNLDHYRVLVVDDNDINRLIAREMISNCGAEVSEAACGEEALIAIRQASDQGKPYRIILLDMRMPGMSGLEVAQKIRYEHLPTEPLILMLSSDDLKPQLSRLKELGLDAYLVKPITRRELFDAIGRVLRDANRNSSDALPNHVPEPPAPNERWDERPKPKILVADDSADNRLLIGAYLRREPCQLEFAENGQIAFDKFKSNQYDMVFMDIQMPEIDGLVATRLIRKWECENHRAPTPIIALTASALEEDVQRTHAAGCDLHLSKPIKKRVLLNTIRNVILLSAKPPQMSNVPEIPSGLPFIC